VCAGVTGKGDGGDWGEGDGFTRIPGLIVSSADCHHSNRTRPDGEGTRNEDEIFRTSGLNVASNRDAGGHPL
jgi:hypothetical protein